MRQTEIEDVIGSQQAQVQGPLHVTPLSVQILSLASTNTLIHGAADKANNEISYSFTCDEFSLPFTIAVAQ